MEIPKISFREFKGIHTIGEFHQGKHRKKLWYFSRHFFSYSDSLNNKHIHLTTTGKKKIYQERKKE
jgi:hypothetical protein